MCGGNNLPIFINDAFAVRGNAARPTHHTSIDESVLEVGVALEQLVPQKRRILKVCVQCDVDR